MSVTVPVTTVRNRMMTKNWLMAGGVLILAVVYVVFFTDWFQPKTMQIFHTTREVRVRQQGKESKQPRLIFGLGHQFRLTEIEVVPLAEWETNRNALPVWHLVSDSNSVPVKMFSYGQPLRGLKPSVAGNRPQPLITNVTYRLFVEAGPVKGQHDFVFK